MSSFVISKVNYIRVAGVICGISKALYREPLWIYNYRDNRNFNDNDYIELFTWIYNANAISVKNQYNDPVADTDNNNYMQDFKEYKKIGEQAIYHGDKKQIVKNISDFFNSVKYQIEDDNLSKKVSCYLNKILVEIVNKTILTGETNYSCWGSFEMEKPETEIVDIMDLVK